jgi:glycosyltransferase involved in cell wall biosynthesis
MRPSSETRDVLLAADGIIVPNETQSNLVKGLDEETPPTHIVVRGLSALTTPPVATPDGGPHIVMVGAIRPVKGQREALEALVKCHELPPTLTLSIVGPIADEEYMNDVRALSNELNLVQFTGAVPHDQMTGIFEQAHALLNFSRHEGASNAILEAWAAGRAVAATDVPGNHELLNDAQPDFATLIDPGAPSTLHSWIINLSERTSDDWADCAIAAHKYVNTAHSLKREIEELLDTYEKTLIHP